MTYIFLDIDGVLSTIKEYDKPRKKFWSKYDIANNLKIPYPFNEGCVKIFNEILTEFECKIIISSDWKLYWTLDELKQIFKFNNVIKDPVDITDNTEKKVISLNQKRYEEIYEYIKKHNIRNFIVIDDLDLRSFLDDDVFILTKEREGLKQTGVKKKIIKLLKSKTDYN